MGNVEKLQKIIGASGVCSRRKAEELIEKGLVTVNGQTAKIGDRADIDIDEIVVDGKKLEKQKAFIYVMLNKPRGYVTTAKDENGRKCVTELVEDIGERVYPVGRLDMYSEGLLLMTNDGDFAYKMTHPRHEMLKEYIVRIKGEGKEPEKVLSLPMDIDGYKINPAIVRLISSSEDVYCVSIKISEGRNRQIRKMCENCGYKVVSLKRVAVGQMNIGTLPVGKWRHLKQEEIDCLKNAAENIKK